MVRVSICKTVVPYPGEPRFVVFLEGEQNGSSFGDLENVVSWLGNQIHSTAEVIIRNEAPDIIWKRDADAVLKAKECQRLSSNEVRELVESSQEVTPATATGFVPWFFIIRLCARVSASEEVSVEIRELFSIIAGVLTVLGTLQYIRAVLNGAQPKRVTWFIWAVLDAIVLTGMWRSGKETNWQIIGCTVAAWTIALLSLKYGVPGWARIDTVSTIGAAVSVVLLRQYPEWALAMSLAAVCCAAVPTYVSAWEDPRRENFASWMMAVVAGILLLCVAPWTFAAAGQPAVFLAVNGTVPLIILIRRPKQSGVA